MGTFYWPASSSPEKTQHILNHFQLPHTPLDPAWWQFYLRNHPDQVLVSQVLRGIREGFPIGYTGPRTHPQSHPQPCYQDPNPMLLPELQKEIELGRMLGPFTNLPQPLFQFYRTNPTFLVPKTDGRWRRIDNMSWPPGRSVNDCIQLEDFPVDYVTTGDIMNHIAGVPKDTPMSSRDIKDAYRQILVNPADWGLLTLLVGSLKFVNIRLGMGIRSACGIFDTLSNLNVWIIQNNPYPNPTPCPFTAFSILDDFLLFHDAIDDNGGRHALSTAQASRDMTRIDNIHDQLGWPMKLSKCHTAVTDLIYLGIGWNTSNNSCYVPRAKREKYLERVKLILKIHSTRISLKVLRSVMGQLCYTCHFIPQTRSRLFHLFVILKLGERRLKRRECLAGRMVVPSSILVSLSPAAISDLEWWQSILIEPPLCRPILIPTIRDENDIFTSDAAPSKGVGAYHRGEAFAFEFNDDGKSKHSTWAELTAVVIACVLWGHLWRGRTIEWRTDCQPHVTGIKKLRSSAPELLALHQCLDLLKVKGHFQIVASHIRGCDNSLADDLSRGVFETMPIDWTLRALPTNLPSIVSRFLCKQSWTTSC